MYKYDGILFILLQFPVISRKRVFLRIAAAVHTAVDIALRTRNIGVTAQFGIRKNAGHDLVDLFYGQFLKYYLSHFYLLGII